MRRAVPLLAALALGLPVAAAPAAKPDAPEISRLLVRGSEFDVTLSSQKIRPGPSLVQFFNDGEDPHDLRIQRQGGVGESGFGEVLPGEYESLHTRFRKASTYVLWCSLGEHRSLGMEATLRTKKRRR